MLGDCQYEVADNSLDLIIDTEDCGIASIVHDYNGGGVTLMGQTFLVGTTDITWTVKDNAGNEASCTFSIIVTDDEVPAYTSCPTTMTVDSLGRLNTYEYIDFLARHAERHLQQIAKIQGAYAGAKGE